MAVASGKVGCGGGLPSALESELCPGEPRQSSARRLIVAYLAFMMGDDIGYEWRQLRRAVTEQKWSSKYGGDWPENRGGIVARIRSRMVDWNILKNFQLYWANFRAASSRRSSLGKSPNPEKVRRSTRSASTAVQGTVSTADQLANPVPSHPQSCPPSDARSSPDRLHRILHICNHNRGTSRNGLISGAAPEVSDSSVRSPTNFTSLCATLGSVCSLQLHILQLISMGSVTRAI
jgi:hypothetical protein